MGEDNIAARVASAVRQAGGVLVVSHKSGVSERVLYNYINGKPAKLLTLAAIAAACSVELDWLMTGQFRSAAKAQPMSDWHFAETLRRIRLANR